MLVGENFQLNRTGGTAQAKIFETNADVPVLGELRGWEGLAGHTILIPIESINIVF